MVLLVLPAKVVLLVLLAKVVLLVLLANRLKRRLLSVSACVGFAPVRPAVQDCLSHTNQGLHR